MLLSGNYLPIRRRIAVYYLMYCLATVTWLMVTAVLTLHGVIKSRTEQSCITTIEREATAIAIKWGRYGTENLFRELEAISIRGPFAYCAVGSPNEEIVVSSNSRGAGSRRRVVEGSEQLDNQIQRLRVTHSDGVVYQEYQRRLVHGERFLGHLIVASDIPSLWSSMATIGSNLRPIGLLPLVLVFAGAVGLYNTLLPLAEIELQLRRHSDASSECGDDLTPIQYGTREVDGWNRLIGQRSNAIEEDLGRRVGDALDSVKRQRVENALNTLPDGLAITDHSGQITFANSSFRSQISAKVNSENILGNTIGNCLDIDTGSHTEQQLTDREYMCRSVVVERTEMAHGEERCWRIARHPVRTSRETTPSEQLWSIRDTTQQKLADRSRSEFIDVATHELRTPLANIQAYAETLATENVEDTERQKEFCNTINLEAARLSRFIDDLLSISSMEAGAIALKRQEVDTLRLVDETIEKVRPQMVQKEVEFKTIVPAKLPSIYVDKDKISATLINILGNAVKYCEDGGQVVFTISHAGTRILFDIEDDGPGINSEELPKVFEKFFRSSNPEIQKKSGTGLGLPLAREVIDLHGGEIAVTSEMGKGAKFSIILPVSDESSSTSASS